MGTRTVPSHAGGWTVPGFTEQRELGRSASGRVTEPYSGYATVVGGKAPYTWGAMTGLPPGLSASGNGARLTVTGTPTKIGDFNATMTVSDSSSPRRRTRRPSRFTCRRRR
jgi:hypothetical protein